MKKIDRDEFINDAMDIVNSVGVSSREYGIVNYIYKNLKNKNIRIQQDSFGSLICRLNSNKDVSKNKIKLLIDTHMDELGLMISNITNDGFLQFLPIGG